jgi:ABC-2 type transport system permease protein
MNTGSPVNTFNWLIKREYWEHRGGFAWTPAIISLVFLAIMLLALVSAEFLARQNGIEINGIHLDQLRRQLGADEAEKLHAAMDVGLLTLGMPIVIGLFFVVFFYCIGALYNDRSDRSALFWKSLPISDTNTVLSKVAAAAIVAPVLALLALMALQVAFLIMMSLYALLHGVNPFPLLWSPAHLVGLWIKLLIVVPVNALWALPTIGWLLLCSSFARSKPFLWAVVVPLVAGALVSYLGLMKFVDASSGWFWRHVVGRVLLSIIPGSWMDATTLRHGFIQSNVDGPAAIVGSLSLDTVGQAVTSPSFLIGIVAGAAMIAAAIYFRRKRVESFA